MSAVPITKFGKSRTGKLSEALGQSLGEGLGSLTNSYFANKAIEEVMADPELQNANSSKRMGALQQALLPFGEYGKNILQTRLEIEKQRIAESKALKEKDRSEELRSALIKRGVPSEVADLYAAATVGGQTEILKDLLHYPGVMPAVAQQTQQDISDTAPPEEKWPELPPETGLRPSNMVSRENAREKVNEKFLNELSKNIHTTEDSLSRVNLMNNLNETDKLPSGAGRINVTSEGKLRFPPGSSPEAELYAKTVNEEMDAAKGTYGARLTNFDAQQFMARLPTLANSKEGRKLILSRLKNVREANLLYDRELQKTLLHYGSNKITESKSREIAESRIKDKLAALRKEGETLDGLMSGSKAMQPEKKGTVKEGSVIRNPKTGARMQFKGGTWQPI